MCRFLLKRHHSLNLAPRYPTMSFTLALTGGPCGGKSSSLSALTTALKDKGFDVYTCPEVPTIMISGGCVYPGESAGQRLIEFETALIRLQLQMENSFQQVARSTGMPSVIIVDRGLIDISAYIPAKQWQEVLSANNLKESELAGRYSMVLHLVTAADGAPEHYSNTNNAARTESAEEAVALDRRIQSAWGQHPSVARVVVDNSTDFAGKIARSVDAVLACVEKAEAKPAASGSNLVGSQATETPKDLGSAEVMQQPDTPPPPVQAMPPTAVDGNGKGKGKGGPLLRLPGKGKGNGGGKGSKGSWPELVGQTGDAAVSAISAAAPGLKVMKVPEGAMVTMDHRLDRVRVYVGTDGKVVRPPKLG